MLSQWPILGIVVPSALVVGLFALYLLSYKKQSAYITKRIAAAKEQMGTD
jgi:hypothetical protein